MVNFLHKAIAFSLLIVGVILVCLLCLFQPIVLVLGVVFAVKWPDRLIGKWGLNVLVGFDNSQSANTGGDPDETISSRLGKAQKQGSSLRHLVKLVDYVAFNVFGQLNHCKKAIEKDEGRDQVTRY